MVIERKINVKPNQAPAPPAAPRKTVMIVLNSIIGVLIIAVVYLCYINFLVSPYQNEPIDRQQTQAIHIDVLNGCGVLGSAALMTDILRKRGFDVVEVRNYMSFSVPYTLVVDRIGDEGSAQKVASALGVDRFNIVRQINMDYFVDVTVVVGKDYNTLKPSPINISKEKD